MSLYEHVPHPYREERKARGPVRVEDHRARSSGVLGRLNARLGLLITISVGTMWAAYVFTAVALLSLPSAISSHNMTIIVAWISSNFLQLILLPIVIVGQNIQAKAADARSEATYKDAEAVLHEAAEIQRHLQAQDNHLHVQDQAALRILAQIQQILDRFTPPTGAAR